MLESVIALVAAATIFVIGASQRAPENSTATSAEQDSPPAEDINRTWFEYPFISQFLFANAVAWPVFWVFCFCVRPCFEQLARKNRLIRKLTGEKLARSKSMTKWCVADRGEYFDPFILGASPTKVSKEATGRCIPRLSRLILSYGTSSGWTYAYRTALFSTVLACAFMRRHEHIVSDKAGYQVAWEWALAQFQDAPWKLFHYLGGKILIENSVPIITGVAATLSAAITATAALCSSCRETSRRLNDLERERARMPTAPKPLLPSKTLSVAGKLCKVAQLPSDVASGIHAVAKSEKTDVGLNSAAANGMRRQSSVSCLDAFVRSKTSKGLAREPTLADFALVPNLDALRWIGTRPPLDLAPSAPPAYDSEE